MALNPREERGVLIGLHGGPGVAVDHSAHERPFANSPGARLQRYASGGLGGSQLAGLLMRWLDLSEPYKRWRFINSVLLVGVVGGLILTPADTLGIKKIALGLMLAVNLPLLIRELMAPRNWPVLFFGVFFPVYLTIFSTLANDWLWQISVSNAYVMIYILLIPIVRFFRLPLLGITIALLAILATWMVVAGIGDLSGIYPLANNALAQWLNLNGEAIIGHWPTTTFGYVIFPKASPLILILAAYGARKRAWHLVILSVAAMAFSGTRANLFISVGLVVAVVISDAEPGRVRRRLVAAIGIVSICLSPLVVRFVMSASALKSSSDLIKWQHLESIVRQWQGDPLTLLTGSGLGSFFYTTGRLDFVSLTEVSPIDLTRQIGLMGMVPFVVFLAIPVTSLLQPAWRWLAVTYLAYLGLTFTNPLLFSSTAFGIYLLAYGVYCEAVSEAHVTSGFFGRPGLGPKRISMSPSQERAQPPENAALSVNPLVSS